MKKCRDAKGNLLKVGDQVKCIIGIEGDAYSIILDKIYKIFSIDDEIIYISKKDGDGWYSFRFVKVNDCLKNKIRKLKRLLNK